MQHRKMRLGRDRSMQVSLKFNEPNRHELLLFLTHYRLFSPHSACGKIKRTDNVNSRSDVRCRANLVVHFYSRAHHSVEP
jgi:hypothetical protein